LPFRFTPPRRRTINDTMNLRITLLASVLSLAACGGNPQTAQPTTPSNGTLDPSGPVVPTTDAPPKSAGARPAQTLQPGPNVTPDGVVFNYKMPTPAKRKIYLAGNFNSWNPSDDNYLMKDDDGDGMWTITVKLAPGTYQYKYVVDGAWTKDPFSPGSAPDGYGGQNSQFDVK
jgi:hypothetical protein